MRMTQKFTIQLEIADQPGFEARRVLFALENTLRATKLCKIIRHKIGKRVPKTN